MQTFHPHLLEQLSDLLLDLLGTVESVQDRHLLDTAFCEVGEVRKRSASISRWQLYLELPGIVVLPLPPPLCLLRR